MINKNAITQFLTLIRETRGLVVITSHKSTDIDGIGASFGLKYIVHQINPQIRIKLLFSSINALAIDFCEYLGISEDITTNTTLPEDTALVLIVDTIAPDTTGITFPPSIPYAIVDHHYNDDSGISPVLTIIDTTLTSASELIGNILTEITPDPMSVSPDVAWALVGGIIADTSRFTRCSSELLTLVASLMKTGKYSYGALVDLFKEETDVSERIARLKAAQRMKIFKLNEIVVVRSHVSCFEAAAARCLILQGADLSIVGGLREDETRISIRCSSAFAKIGVHVGKDIAFSLAKKLKGTGSGHKTAGGVNLDYSIDEKTFNHIVDDIISELNRLLSKSSDSNIDPLAEQ